MIPEDRHDSGCVLDMSVAENLEATSFPVGQDIVRRVDSPLMEEGGIVVLRGNRTSIRNPPRSSS